mgnify:CR=1 FL=1
MLAPDDLVGTPLPACNWWAEAEVISHAHIVSLNVRTLDLLHVAAARVLGATEFPSFDIRRRALAKAAGSSFGPLRLLMNKPGAALRNDAIECRAVARRRAAFRLKLAAWRQAPALHQLVSVRSFVERGPIAWTRLNPRL